jgi:MFS family permease
VPSLLGGTAMRTDERNFSVSHIQHTAKSDRVDRSGDPVRHFTNVTPPHSVVLAAIINIVGGALQAGSVHVGMFIAARFVTGFAAAMFVSMVPLYIAEVAPPAVRGLLVGQHGS